MRLHFPFAGSSAERNIRGLKHYGYDIHRIIAPNAKTIDKLVLLGNGSPEDEIIGIMGLHLDGDMIVGIVKPEKPDLPALDFVKEYILETNVIKILFVVDQDDRDLDALFTRATKRLRDSGIRVEPETDYDDIDRARVYRCYVQGTKTRHLIIVVSGDENFATPQHEIEDHLLMIAGIERAEKGSKEKWKSLNKADKDDVFRLLKNKDLFEIAFPHHVCGCNCLEKQL